MGGGGAEDAWSVPLSLRLRTGCITALYQERKTVFMPLTGRGRP
jgi:hypothetical protein